MTYQPHTTPEPLAATSPLFGVGRCYVAGPMTGYPDLNFPQFHAEAARLRAIGWHVENPAELCDDIAGQWAACMRRDITALLTCDAVLMLPGWQRSEGASLEHHIAQKLGLMIVYLPAAGSSPDDKPLTPD